MIVYYRLEGHTPVPEPDASKFALWFSQFTVDRCVGRTSVRPGVDVSTVFLGINHQFMPDRPPLLFETMVFGGSMNDHQVRTSTWEQAEQAHKEAVRMACEAEGVPFEETVALPFSVPVCISPCEGPTWHERISEDDPLEGPHDDDMEGVEPDRR